MERVLIPDYLFETLLWIVIIFLVVYGYILEHGWMALLPWVPKHFMISGTSARIDEDNFPPTLFQGCIWRNRSRRMVVAEILDMKGENVSSYHKYGGPQFFLNCYIGDASQPIGFLVDTGCTCSAIDFRTVKDLGLWNKVDWTNRRYEAVDGEMRSSYGMLHVPVKTAKGFPILRKMVVLKMKGAPPLLGLDALAVNNCYLSLSTTCPVLVIRRNVWESFGDPFFFKNAAKVMAKLDGQPYECILDTGSTTTVIPKDFNFDKISFSEPIFCDVAADEPLRVSKGIAEMEVQVDKCSGHVFPIAGPLDRPLIGTDFLHNKTIFFYHGKVYVDPIG